MYIALSVENVKPVVQGLEKILKCTKDLGEKVWSSVFCGEDKIRMISAYMGGKGPIWEVRALYER